MTTDRWTDDEFDLDDFTSWHKPRARFFLDTQFVLLALTLIGIATMCVLYIITLKPVALVIAHQESRTVFTNQTRVAGILDDAALDLAPEDIVFPAPAGHLNDARRIEITRARPIEIQADGQTIALRTQQSGLNDIIGEANLLLKPGDQIFLDVQRVEPRTRLAPSASNELLRVAIKRAVPIQVEDNGAMLTLYTTAPKLGEALRQAGLILYVGDYVSPDLGTPVAPGWQVYIRRSRALTINADGKTFRTRTRNDTIAGMLKDEGLELAGKDFTIPAATESTRDGMTVNVTRVREEFITESDSIAFETVYQPDPALEIDVHQVAQTGVEGTKKRTIRITYENGREVRRAVDKEWIEAAPLSHIINYGTKIILRELTLPTGQTITYWRKIRMLATSYTAATSGKARTHPEFGITATGMRAGVGIVAVDPRMVNLRSRVYVPGYGIATAGDTGGRIKGRRIDLGYDEENLILWYTWLDVYLLAPAPPADQIRWVLLDTPRERTSNR